MRPYTAIASFLHLYFPNLLYKCLDILPKKLWLF